MEHEESEAVDLVVLGGGPAGSTTSVLLKQALPDARVVLLERERFPRHHVGESLLPNANPLLAKTGVLPKLESAGFLRKGGVSIRWVGATGLLSEWFGSGVNQALHGSDGTPLPDHAWQVERARYDVLLLEHARSCGVEVWQPAAVTEVLREGERVCGVRYSREGKVGALRSRFVVDCTGQARLLGRLLGLPREEHDLGDLAVYRYYEGFHWQEELLGTPQRTKIFFAATPPYGWVWFIVLSEKRASVGAVLARNALRERSLEEQFDKQLAMVPEFREMLRDAWRVAPEGAEGSETRSLSISNWSYAHERLAGPGWYLAGDAAAFVDPVLSSGVMLAQQAGLWVANAVVTELRHPEVPTEQLHTEYRAVYESARSAFAEMAAWWYHLHDRWDNSWLSTAGALMRRRMARGAEGLSDKDAFLRMVGGHLSDFRFQHVGFGGFGQTGLAVVATEQLAEKSAPLGEEPEARSRVELGWDRVELGWYLGTYLETNRWWRLPVLRFYTGEQSTELRPQVHLSPAQEPDLEATLDALVALLAACQTARVFGDFDNEMTRHRAGIALPLEAQRRAHSLRDDLLRVGLLRRGEVEEPVGPGSRIQSMSQVPRRLYSKVEVERLSLPGVEAERALEPVLRFDVAGRAVRFRPREEHRGLLRALLASCDGARTVDTALVEMRKRLGLGEELAVEVQRSGYELLEELLQRRVLALSASAAR